MKKNLRSACLLLLIFLFFFAGFAGIGSAKIDPYDYLKFNFSEKEIVGSIKPPMTSYPIWGYKDKNYTFFANYTASPEDLPNITMVFYWDWSKNSCKYKDFLLNDPRHFVNDIDYTNDTRKCSYAWNETGNYSVAVGIFKKNSRGQWEGKNVSYWIPIEIRNNTTIIVENISMLDEDEGFGCSNSTYNVTSLDNSSKNYSCGYVDNDYSFSVKLNATSQSSADNRTINETTTVVYWNYSSSNSSNSDNKSDNSILGNIDDKSVTIKNINSSAKSVTWDRNFTHEWNETGKKNINATAFHWDPLDGSEMYLNYNNTSILIIPDPKNLVSYPIIGNLQNWGILLSILGLVIFYFTYTRNNVPIKIALFGMKPFYLKSVNSLTGTFIFVAGMYLYFVFGRCPWDIPIVNGLPRLSNMYFGILYREYVIKQWSIPYLSILIGMLDVIILSLIIHLIAIPFYKGEFKIGEFLRRKLSSTSAKPELVSYSVENKINQDN